MISHTDYQLSVDAMQTKDGWIAYCNELRISTCSATEGKAKKRLLSTIDFILQIAEEEGDLDLYLSFHGVKRKVR